MAKSKDIELDNEQQVEETPKSKEVRFFNPTSGRLSFTLRDGSELCMNGNATCSVSEEDSYLLEGTVLIKLH